MSTPPDRPDLEALRRIFHGGGGEHPSHNAILQLCDEVESLRAALARSRAANRSLALEIVRLRAAGMPRIAQPDDGT